MTEGVIASRLQRVGLLAPHLRGHFGQQTCDDLQSVKRTRQRSQRGLWSEARAGEAKVHNQAAQREARKRAAADFDHRDGKKSEIRQRAAVRLDGDRAILDQISAARKQLLRPLTRSSTRVAVNGGANLLAFGHSPG